VEEIGDAGGNGLNRMAGEAPVEMAEVETVEDGGQADFIPRGLHPKSIINEIKWRGYSLEETEIEILHRGAPRDRIIARASEIDLGRSFFSLAGTEIPYHRIQVIRFRGRAIFRRTDIVKSRTV